MNNIIPQSINDKINTLFDFVNKMEKSEDPEDINNIKNDMNTFFQTDRVIISISFKCQYNFATRHI